MAVVCCLLGMTFDFPPLLPNFLSPCFLQREHTASFQLILNVGFVFFTRARAMPAYETKLPWGSRPGN